MRRELLHRHRGLDPASSRPRPRGVRDRAGDPPHSPARRICSDGRRRGGHSGRRVSRRLRSVFLIQATERGLELGRPWQEVEPLCRDAARLAKDMGHRTHACWALTGLARIEMLRGDMAAAGRIWGAASEKMDANPTIMSDRSYKRFAEVLEDTTDPRFLEAFEAGRAIGLGAVLDREAVRPDREA